MHLPTQVANKFFILLLLVLIHFLKLPCPGREGGSRRLYKVKAPKSQKFNKRSMAGTITGETKREDQRKHLGRRTTETPPPPSTSSWVNSS
jgi:hypothetical protein